MSAPNYVFSSGSACGDHEDFVDDTLASIQQCGQCDKRSAASCKRCQGTMLIISTTAAVNDSPRSAGSDDSTPRSCRDRSDSGNSSNGDDKDDDNNDAEKIAASRPRRSS